MRKTLLSVFFLLLICHARAQNINTIAGDGFSGYFGDGGPATAAELFDPAGVALDAVGNLYIADEANNVIRKVNTSGVITTIGGTGFGAGTFSGAYTGDGGAATAAKLFFPAAITLDASGNIFFTDAGNNVIRKISTTGTITTVVGNGFGAGTFTGGYTGDGGPATAAEMNEPFGITFDNSGNLYIADFANNVVRKVSTTGIIRTVAGNGFGAGTGSGGYAGDGGAATAAEMAGTAGVAVDNSGNLYISDALNNVIRKVNTSGIITTIAGGGPAMAGYSGDGGPATAARLNSPFGLSLDNAGNLFIADQGNNVIRKISTSGIISTWAGNGAMGFLGDGGPAISAEMAFPTGMAISSSGSMYIADEGNSVVRKTGTIIGAGGLCIGQTTTLTDLTTGGTWASSNTAVATIVSATGFVTAVAAGTTTITYTVSGHSETMTFAVAHPPIAITGIFTLCSGTETLLSDAITGGTWSSSAPSVAMTFSPFSGDIFGASAGTTTITYATSPGCFVTATVNVLPGPDPFFGGGELCIGTPTTFFNGVPGGTWTSRNTAVVTVDPTTGDGAGLMPGSTFIVYTLSSGCADSEFVDVSVAPVVGAISGPSSACVGATVHLSNTVAGGFWETASGGFVANIDFSDGSVTGMSAGTDIISYFVSNVCSTAVATYTFTVDGFPAAGTITGPDTVCLGGSTHLTDLAPGGTWSTGSSTVATVTSSGTVYGALDGSVEIIYTATNSCGSASTTFPIMVVSNGACGLSTHNVPTLNTGKMQVFPNPNDGSFAINILSAVNEQATVVIANVVGAKVMEFTAPVNTIVPVNIQPSLGAGIYILSATTASGKFVAKITVE